MLILDMGWFNAGKLMTKGHILISSRVIFFCKLCKANSFVARMSQCESVEFAFHRCSNNKLAACCKKILKHYPHRKPNITYKLSKIRLTVKIIKSCRVKTLHFGW